MLVAVRLQLARSAYRSWADVWVEARAAREALVRSTARRFAMMAEGRGFRRWQELWDTRRRLRYKAELLLGRSSKTRLLDAFGSWAATTVVSADAAAGDAAPATAAALKPWRPIPGSPGWPDAIVSAWSPL